MTVREYAGVIVGVLAFACWLPSAGKANWAYTHWGMSPEQVVAASGGAVALLPSEMRTKNEYDHWELAAQGTYTDVGMQLPVGFTFDTKSGGLKCVMVNAFEDDTAKLRKLMDQRYGKSSHESIYGPLTTVTWRTPDKIELATGQKPLASVVTHCMP